MEKIAGDWKACKQAVSTGTAEVLSSIMSIHSTRLLINAFKRLYEENKRTSTNSIFSISVHDIALAQVHPIMTCE
jgi:Kef-type K+ transport system membrane component KefB